MRNTALILSLFVIASGTLTATSSMASISLSQDVDAEKVTTIATSKVNQRYGSWLFNGAFSQHSFSAVNPEYRITQGDKLLVQVWGGIDHQAEVAVDPQGNIFIPKVGPIKVLGVSNAKLNGVILNSVKRVYKSNVEVYVSLMSSQQVKVFLSGMVTNPGLYEGQSADSVLRFIDQAGGIRNDIGSYRNIQVKRNGKVQQQIDLYQFLQQGTMPPLQLQDGDVIFIGPKQGEITIEGKVGFQGRYELKERELNQSELNHNALGQSELAQENLLQPILDAVVADEQATHVTVISPEAYASASSPEPYASTSSPEPDSPERASMSSSKSGNREVNARQYTIIQAANVKVQAGALIKVTSQLRANSISVDLIGEHNSAQEMVLPWGASLADLISQTEFTRLSNQGAVQLYRQSVADRQFDMLQASLSSLEQTVLTQRSNTKESAELRKAEAEIILKWIDKARQVQPKGQVLLGADSDLSQIVLQQGDKVVIPAKRNLVIIHGEVMFPTAIAYSKDLSTEDFINKAGGANQDLDDMNILIMKPNGSFVNANDDLEEAEIITPGDEIFVLSKPDEKGFQLAKDIAQIMYQIALSAAVVLAL